MDQNISELVDKKVRKIQDYPKEGFIIIYHRRQL